MAVLLEVYIEANRWLLYASHWWQSALLDDNHAKKRLAAEDEEFASEARQAFAKLEEGHQQSLQDWKICRHFLSFVELN